MDLAASPMLQMAAATIGRQITNRALSQVASKSLANISAALASHTQSVEVCCLQLPGHTPRCLKTAYVWNAHPAVCP